MRIALGTVAILFALVAADKPDPVAPDPQSPRPIPIHETLFTEDMTWMEVRDVMASGKKTILVATGGVEQNGPYLVTGKHNVVLRATTQAIAERLEDTLIAPIVPFVPEGDFSPPSLHMKYPGTVSVTEDTFRRLLTDICTSFQVTGFEHIVLIGDSGGNQEGMKAVAETLNAAWKGGTRVHFIPEYYNYDKLKDHLTAKGIHQEEEGFHDDFGMSAILLSIDPDSVRMPERIAAKRFSINGVDLAPLEKSVAWGKTLIAMRAETTVAAIRKSRGN